MVSRIKDFFGIEGISIQCIVRDFSKKDGILQGDIIFETLKEQSVSKLTVAIFERYSRGRGKEKRIDVVKLSEITTSIDLSVHPEETVILPFEIEFQTQKSRLEQLSSKYKALFPLKALGNLAAGVKNEYWIEGKAEVKGVKLSPRFKIDLED